MKQTLCYLPETLFGLPLFGWGLMLGLLVAIVMLTHGYQYFRYKKIGDAAGSFFLLLVGSAVLVFVIPNIVEQGYGLPIRGYGVCLLCAIIAAFLLVLRLAKRNDISASDVSAKNVPADTIPTGNIYSLCFWAVATGIVGARLFYVTEYWQVMLQFDPQGQILLLQSLWSILNLADGGIVVFGAILGGILGALIFMLLKKMPVWQTFDILAPALMLGIAIGRIGCLLNGCCFGSVTDLPIGITFPAGSPAHLHQIAHGSVFYYGMKFAEKNVNGKPLLAIEHVQPGSDAEKLGLKSGRVLRSILDKRSDPPMVWAVNSNLSLATLLAPMQKDMPVEKVRFDFYTNAALNEAMPYELGHDHTEVLPVHPAQIYSSVSALLLCGLLLLLGRCSFYQRHSGLVFASFVMLYSAGRFMLEIVRTDEDSFFGTGLTVSQNVSIAFFLAGVVLYVFVCQKGKQK